MKKLKKYVPSFLFLLYIINAIWSIIDHMFLWEIVGNGIKIVIGNIGIIATYPWKFAEESS